MGGGDRPSGSLETVKLLIDHGAQIDVRIEDGGTAVIGAAESGHVEVVRALIEAGADVNAETEFGETALMGAAEDGCIDCVKLLLERGADIDQSDDAGETALIKAERKGHSAVVGWLKKEERKRKTKPRSCGSLIPRSDALGQVVS